MGTSGQIIVSYCDSVLRESDVALLEGPAWLNDTILSFYFEYLSNDVFKGKDQVIFVGPEVTHCLKAAATSELPLFLDPIHAKDKDICFFALNDSRLYGQSGGTHWSLLVYCRPENKIIHFNSMSGQNYRQAGQLSGKLLKYLSPTGQGDFEDADCLQQDNGYDCGIFVLCHAEHLARIYLKSGSNKDLTGASRISQAVVNGKRAEILRIVNELKKQ